MADVRDILDLERPVTPELTKDMLLNTKKRQFTEKVRTTKRPEGMHREVFALLYNDNKDGPPLLPTDTGSGYKQVKARLGMKKVRKWEWTPFTNSARSDSAVFHHWKRITDEPIDYPFARFNKQLSIPTYTINEYTTHLRTNQVKWSKAQTDHLFDLAKRFDIRFVVMADRWDRANFGIKSVEDLKERYYEVCGILTKIKGTPDKKVYMFDAEHERKRKEQLKKLFERTTKQIEEEQLLVNELKKIEARKKERERKTQDLQKLISQADQQVDTPTAQGGVRKLESKKLTKKKIQTPQRPNKVDLFSTTIETAGIKFTDLRGSGVSLRSQRMKIPANVGQKKVKTIEQILAEYNCDQTPPPIESICSAYNELRSDMVLFCELRTAFQTCMFEIESLKHQFEVLAPGKTLTIPTKLLSNPNPDDDNKQSEFLSETASSV